MDKGFDESSPLKNYQNNSGRMNPTPTLKAMLNKKIFLNFKLSFLASTFSLNKKIPTLPTVSQ